MTNSSSSARFQQRCRIGQNFRLIWLDATIDEMDNEDCRHTMTKLRSIVNSIDTFTDVDECVDFISEIKVEKAFVMISGALGQHIVPTIHSMPHVDSIYIISSNKSAYEQLIIEWTKVKGVFTDIKSICEGLKQDARQCDRNLISISFIEATTGDQKPNLDELPPTFMYTKLLKEILLELDYDKPVAIKELVDFYRKEFEGQLPIINEFERDYCRYTPIYWYTRTSISYEILNRALRMFELDTVVKMGFFVRDLHNQITQLHSEQKLERLTLYRGQGISAADFEMLTNTHGGLLSFNNFLSTSKNEEISLIFARSSLSNPQSVAILFKIEVDPSISSTPYAQIDNESYFTSEQEILFSMQSVFRIGQFEQLEDRLWQVKLKLTADDDPQLQVLTERMRKEIFGFTGWHRLGDLMIKTGNFRKAEEISRLALDTTLCNDYEGLSYLYSQLGRIKNNQGAYEQAVEFYEKSHEMMKKYLPPIHPILATSYNGIGVVYFDMGEYLKAIEYFEKALEIWKMSLPPNHPDLAASYNNISSVYSRMEEYSKVLEFDEKALEIRKISLPPNHPDLATSYNNIGSDYSKMGEYLKALEFYEKALEIWKISLPPNHPDLAAIYSNIGSVYCRMGEYLKALEFDEKALEIREISLPLNHPDLASSYNELGSVYSSIGEYSKALEFYEKSHVVFQISLPSNHPNLATSYSSIGSVYSDMGEYSRALEYYQKSHEIYQISLPSNHSDLATNYHNIGSVYSGIGEYSRALEYYQKAYEIFQISLPSNHPNLATSYSSIGLVYSDMGEYSKALESYEKALEIRKTSLPSNHSDLAKSYSSIGSIYSDMEEYSKALESYEKALEIRKTSLPSNHPDLATSYSSIGSVYSDMGEYSKALSSCESALEIFEKSLSPNRPVLAICYNNIGELYYNMKDYKKAISFVEKAEKILQVSLSPNHPNLKALRENLANSQKKF